MAADADLASLLVTAASPTPSFVSSRPVVVEGRTEDTGSGINNPPASTGSNECWESVVGGTWLKGRLSVFPEAISGGGHG